MKIRPGISAVFRTLDCLLSDEQLVMKLCCATLGNDFSRDILFYVLNPGSPREFALAIKNLFEMKVLKCAKGNFSDDGLMVTSEKTFSPPIDDEITCECRDNEIDETCLDLPKYASCSYMQFYNTYIRDITYLSSVDAEKKKEFHLRAMEYLLKQIEKCPTCDYEPLGQLLNPTAAEQQDLMESQLRHSTPLSSTSIQYDLSTVTVPVTPVEGTDCQCLPILERAYIQIMAYYKNANSHFMTTSKIIYILLKYASILIRSSDLRSALKVLTNALGVFKTRPLEDLSWQNKLVGGKIDSLMGYAYMQLNKFEKAEFCFRSALKQYDCEFSPDKITNKVRAMRLRLKQSFGLFVLPNKSTKKLLNQWELYVCNNVSGVLSDLTTLFMKEQKWQYAELAATWNLSKALTTDNEFEIICTYYSTMLMIALHSKRTKLSAAIVTHALHLCELRTEDMNQRELKALTKLYTSIFWFELPQANIEKTKEIGDIAFRTAKSTQALELVRPILPMLLYICLLTKDLDAAVQVLDELSLFADNQNNCADDDESRVLWFAAQCMAFQLETDHFYTSLDVFEEFGEALVDEYKLDSQEKEARNNYCAIVWLWFVRNHNLEKAAFWYHKIIEFFQLENNGSVVNHLNGLYILEGLITSVVYIIDENDKQSCRYLKKQIGKLIEVLERSAKNMKIIRPRLMHMKAYYYIVLYNDPKKAFKYLKKAKKLAVESKNTLDEEWVMHSLKVWKKTMEEADLKFGQEHCDEQQQQLYDDEMDPDVKFGYFSLPLPTQIGHKIKKPSQLIQNCETDEGDADCRMDIYESINLHGSFDCSLTGSDGSQMEPWVAEIMENLHTSRYFYPTHVGNEVRNESHLTQNFEIDEGDADCWMNNREPINQDGSSDRSLTGSDGSEIDPWLQAVPGRLCNTLAYFAGLSDSMNDLDNVSMVFNDTSSSDSSGQTNPRLENLMIEPSNELTLASDVELSESMKYLDNVLMAFDDTNNSDSSGQTSPRLENFIIEANNQFTVAYDAELSESIKDLDNVLMSFDDPNSSDSSGQPSSRLENFIIEANNEFSLAATNLNSPKGEFQKTIEVSKELENTSAVQEASTPSVPIGCSGVGAGQPLPPTSDCGPQPVGDQAGGETMTTGTVTKEIMGSVRSILPTSLVEDRQECQAGEKQFRKFVKDIMNEIKRLNGIVSKQPNLDEKLKECNSRLKSVAEYLEAEETQKYISYILKQKTDIEPPAKAVISADENTRKPKEIGETCDMATQTDLILNTGNTRSEIIYKINAKMEEAKNLDEFKLINAIETWPTEIFKTTKVAPHDTKLNVETGTSIALIDINTKNKPILLNKLSETYPALKTLTNDGNDIGKIKYIQISTSTAIAEDEEPNIQQASYIMHASSKCDDQGKPELQMAYDLLIRMRLLAIKRGCKIIKMPVIPVVGLVRQRKLAEYTFRGSDIIVELYSDVKQNIAKTAKAHTKAKTKTELLTNSGVIKVKDLDGTTTKEDVVFALSKVLGVNNEMMKVNIPDQPNKIGLKIATVTLDKINADKLVKRGRLMVGWTRCRVERLIFPRRCDKCLKYGHLSRQCDATTTMDGKCLKCCKTGHIARECTNNPICYECDKKGHQAGTMKCPIYRKIVNGIKEGQSSR